MKSASMIMKNNVLLLFTIALLVGNIVFWGSQKEGYHVDEMFSYEQVGNTEYPKPTYNRPDEPCWNYWHSRAYYEDYLTISEGERFNLVGFYRSASKNDAHPPLYLMLLGMFISAVSPNHFTKWSGIGLNILFYILMLLVLYDMSKRVLKKERPALLSVFLCGLSVGIVSMAVFIRVYIILMFFVVSFADVHVRMLEQKQVISSSLRKRMVFYFELALLFVGGAMSQYYFLVYAFFLCLGFWLILLITRERRLLLEYAIAVAGGFCVYCLLWPGMLNDILYESRGVESAANFAGAEKRYATEAVHYFRGIDKETTGGLFAALIVVFVIALIVKTIRKYALRIRLEGSAGIQISYQRPSAISLPAGTGIVSVNIEWAMLAIVLVPAVSYVMLIAKIAPTLPSEPYKTTRYITCVYPFFILFDVFFIDRILLRYNRTKILKAIIWPLLILMAVTGYFTGSVKHLYPGAVDQLEMLNAYSGDRAVLVTEAGYVSSDLNVYFTKHEAVYLTNHEGLSTLSAAFEGTPDEEILVYICDRTEDSREVLKRIGEEINVTDSSFLFKTAGSNRADVYLMNLKRME